MKKFLSLIVVLCSVFTLTGCGAQNDSFEVPASVSESLEDKISAIDEEETYPPVPATLAVVYNNVDEIVADADVIVKAAVKEQSVEMLDGYPQTHTIVEVLNVLKGDAAEGDLLEVVEEGGYDGKVVCGLPQLSDENDYYLMLIKYNGFYYVCGAFQGRFVEREGYVFQQAVEDVKLSHSYSPATSESFESLIGEALSAEELS